MSEVHDGWLNEVLQHFQLLLTLPETPRTAWTAKTFAEAALAAYQRDTSSRLPSSLRRPFAPGSPRILNMDGWPDFPCARPSMRACTMPSAAPHPRSRCYDGRLPPVAPL